MFIAALLLSSVLTHELRNRALKYGWGCAPARNRDVHHGPMPRLGGVAIYFAFLLVMGIYVAACKVRGVPPGFSLYTAFFIFAPATLMFILGLLDDLRSVQAYTKFGVQAIAGMLLWYGGIRLSILPIFSGYHEMNALLSLGATIFWVLLISNAFNLIDGLDGLSAGSALFSTLVVFGLALFVGAGLTPLMTAVLAGALLGFLRYNFNPATIFLGDSGSLFIGFILAAVSLVGAQKSATAVAVAIPILSFGVPLLDTLLSVARRFLSGQPLFSADREHIHHKLLKRGFSQRQAVLILYAVSALLGLMSLLLLYPTGSSVGVVLTVVGVGIWFGVQHLGYHEFAELGDRAKRTFEQKRIIVNNLAVRRATEELAHVSEFAQVCRILESAFIDNEFDGFELVLPHVCPMPGELAERVQPGGDGKFRYVWSKVPAQDPASNASWRMTLTLPVTKLQYRTELTLYRLTSTRSLQFDINLLSSDFQSTLAHALSRSFQAAPTPEPVLMRRAAAVSRN